MIKRGFVRNTFTLVSANIIAQIITITFIPVITRIYSPESFGQFSTLLALSVVLAAISSLRYSAAILLPERESDADAVTVLCVYIVTAQALLVILGVVLLDELIVDYTGVVEHSYVIYLIPLIVYLAGIKFVLDSWYLREEGFRGLAFSRINGAVSDRFVTIAYGLTVTAGPVGLFAGKVASLLLSILSIMAAHRGRQVTAVYHHADFTLLKKVASRYKRFPIYSWSSLVQQLSIHLPVLLLGLAFSPVIVGNFALAKSVLDVPGNTISEAISKSFFQKVARDKRGGVELSGPTLLLFKVMLSYTVIPAALVSLLFEDGFALLFGETWKDAGLYAQATIPLILAVFMIRPLSVFFDLFEKQKEQGVFNLIILVAGGLALILCGKYYDAYTTIVSYSIITTLLVVGRIVMLLGYVGISYMVSMKLLIVYITTGVLLCSFALVLSGVYGVYPGVTAGILLLGYVIYLFFTDPFMRRMVSSYIRAA